MSTIAGFTDSNGVFVAPGGGVRNAYAVTDNVVIAAAHAFAIRVSVAGTVTLTLAGGATIIIEPAASVDLIYPYAVTKATATTATITRMYNVSYI